MAAIPQALIDEINAGNCVAFVGAGFSAAGELLQWKPLLSEIAKLRQVSGGVREHVEQRVKEGTAHALDEAAQVLEDFLTTPVFVRELEKRLAKPKINPRMEQRLSWLRGIPFRAILTLNFDGYLQGATPSTSAYQSVLRPTNYEWWDERYWRKGATGCTVLKLHGDFDAAGSIVFTRRGYRRLLYENPAYLSFLRAVLAEHTVLYLGFSFADAYLNELRSEALAMIGYGARSTPIAYAMLNDASATTCAHLRRTEGVEVLSYDSKNPADYLGFDQALGRSTIGPIPCSALA